MNIEQYVVHCKKDKYDVYIGRPSKWGNPFTIGKDGNREEVIRKYAGWIIKQTELLNNIQELKGKVLGCWCSPKACHGHILSAIANSEHFENNNEWIISYNKYVLPAIIIEVLENKNEN
jgi:hypothetical protein